MLNSNTQDLNRVKNQYGITMIFVTPPYFSQFAAVFGAENCIGQINFGDYQTAVPDLFSHGCHNYYIDEPGRNGTDAEMQGLVSMVHNYGGLVWAADWDADTLVDWDPLRMADYAGNDQYGKSWCSCACVKNDYQNFLNALGPGKFVFIWTDVSCTTETFDFLNAHGMIYSFLYMQPDATWDTLGEFCRVAFNHCWLQAAYRQIYNQSLCITGPVNFVPQCDGGSDWGVWDSTLQVYVASYEGAPGAVLCWSFYGTVDTGTTKTISCGQTP